MLVCLDVDYRSANARERARAARVIFDRWDAAEPTSEHAVELDDPAEYEPGQFFRRELPCLRAVLPPAPDLDVIVVDGYVWLDPARERPGLGAHLWEALDRSVAVVGVAKNPFAGAGGLEVRRGESQRPLIVTAAGVDDAWAAERIVEMHGPHRIPTLLRRVDELSRAWAD